jgi:hypothetical protein
MTMKTREVVDPRWHILTEIKRQESASAGRYAKVFYADNHRGFGLFDRVAFGASTGAASASSATIDAFMHPGFDYDCSDFHGLITVRITKCGGCLRLISAILS